MSRRWLARAAAISFATLHLSCGEKAPTSPTAGASQPVATLEIGSARALNVPPNLVVRTTPAADYSTNPPTISGAPPLDVFFGLCQSDDPDQGDSLNWQYNFGDSGRKPFNDDGSFNPDTDHACRTEHTYAEGTYTAWVSVTDKHLEDQSKGVRSLARRSQAFTIKAEFPRTPPAPPSVPAVLPPNCHTITKPNGACPTGATSYCVSDPVVSPTNPAHALTACNACFGAGSCSNFNVTCFGTPTTSFQASVNLSALNAGFVYNRTSASGPLPGETSDFLLPGCPAGGRWAP
jgi:hypothetical protein